jgi:trehalose-phosphatase
MEIREAWTPLAERGALELHPFDGGLELRVPGRDKGFAVRRIFADLDEGAAVAYLGDDRTDEDAFRALDGRGLSVLVRREPRPTAAELRLEPPEELLQFLSQGLTVCASEGRGS